MTSLRRISAESSTYQSVREIDEHPFDFSCMESMVKAGHQIFSIDSYKQDSVVLTYRDGQVFLFEQVKLGGFVLKHQYQSHLKNIGKVKKMCEKIAKGYLEEKQLAALCGPSRFEIANGTLDLIKDLNVSA